MELKAELLREVIADAICEKINGVNINADEITQTRAIDILEQIVRVIRNDTLSDFDMVDEIVLILHKNHISAGSTHDFG